MNRIEHKHLLAERAALQRMIEDTPVEDVIDRGSLVARLEEIDEMLVASKPDEREPARVRLTFRGKPVIGTHGIFAEFGARALSSFNESVAAMAASQTAPLAAMGPIPNREQHEMLITSTALGSFGFELEEPPNSQLTFDGASPVALALDRTRQLLHGTLGSDEDLADSASEVDGRAMDKVRAFLQTLIDYEATCAMETGGAKVHFSDVGQVRTSLARLSYDNLREEVQTLVGELQGVLPDGRIFEFKLAEDGRIIRGKVSPLIADPGALNQQLRRPSSIRVMVTRVGNGRPRYVLLEAPELQ